MFCPDLKGGSFSYNIIDEDNLGRILYEYTTQNQMSGNEETVLVICQKISDDYVYFYEDICYLLPDYSNQDIDQLKAANDWNEPLIPDKMSRRPNNISFDLFIITDFELIMADVRRSLCKKMSIMSEQIEDFFIVDVDNSRNGLFYLHTRIEDKERCYLVFVDTSYHISTFEINDDTIKPEEIAGFKQQNKWTYGY